MSKYAELTNYFKGIPSDQEEVRLKFADIELMIGEKLPKSAREHEAWWANSHTADSHDWAHRWLREGWEKSDLDIPQESVAFRRTQKTSPIREFVLPPSDIEEPPHRVEAHVQRIVRDTAGAKSLKAIYSYKCQVCGLRIEPAPGSYYIEVHHVRPLGGGHKGFDTHSNMLVLCPNHHAMFDFGIPRFIGSDQISIGGTIHALTCKHKLTDDVIVYHNEHIHRAA